ncbi:hypothetical protein BT96DRAFT_1026508 [Gymnopus androsaceus JB14]|uniref:Uncharacterized protein n=1 Tax=Gymnopus androsaceus JB14 TaxID=1447944 RepID=A0A6A4GKB5_9AGAR|nr:hypothetical protein BT96DRAFT_1026508 [Gymnopus androsaceus JB14]
MAINRFNVQEDFRRLRPNLDLGLKHDDPYPNLYVDPRSGDPLRPPTSAEMASFSSNVDVANCSTTSIVSSNVNASSTSNTAQELPILNITTSSTLNADAGPKGAVTGKRGSVGELGDAIVSAHAYNRNVFIIAASENLSIAMR